MKKQLSSEDLATKTITVSLPTHIIQDLREMEKNTNKTLDELIVKSLLMFIATHSDYLTRNDK